MFERGNWDRAARVLMVIAALEVGGVSAVGFAAVARLGSTNNLLRWEWPGYSGKVTSGDCLWDDGCEPRGARTVRGAQLMINKKNPSGAEELWFNRGILLADGCLVVIDVEPMGGGEYVNKNWSSCGR